MEAHNNKHFTAAVPHKCTLLLTCSKVRKCLQHLANLPYCFYQIQSVELFTGTLFSQLIVSLLFKAKLEHK